MTIYGDRMRDTYYEEIYYDVCRYIADNIEIPDYIDNFGDIDTDELTEDLYEECFADDSVTGNASGSYYCNAYKAAEKVHANIDLLIEAIESFGAEAEDYKRALTSPEWADVTIRCYYLYEVCCRVSEYISEIYKDTDITAVYDYVKGA